MILIEQLRSGEHKAYYITVDGVVHDRRCLQAADLLAECKKALRDISLMQGNDLIFNARSTAVTTLAKLEESLDG